MTGENTVDTLRRQIEHAPRDPGPIAKDLRGWWMPDGYYICARCAGRIVARGCGLPADAKPVWRDRPEPYGVCVTCKEVQS